MDLDARFPESVSVTGQEIDESSFSETWKRAVLGLEERIIEKYRRSGKERFVAAFGGASGSGKSTAAKTLEALLRSENIPATAVSQDGYHFTKEYLLRALDDKGEPLAEHKGRYDSFDVPALKRDLERFLRGEDFAFPEYSRTLHDPIPNAIAVEGPALLIFEGLWILCDRTPWNELLGLYDVTVFFNASPEIRMRNAVARHVRGGRSPAEAESFYRESDEKNAENILKHIARHDMDFFLT